MAGEQPRQYHPLTCHGHSRPVPHVSFSPLEKDGVYYMISACKDNNPMLRDGITGDWIGTFIGHKGAVWQARMSPDSLTAATASADFTANIWDVHTGELLYVLQHNHIVRAVAYAPDNSDLVATGGMEKKLRIFDLTEMKPKEEPAAATNDTAEAAGLSQQPNGVSSTAAPLTNGGSAASVLSSSVSSVSSAAGGAPVAQPQQPETTGPITIPASSAFEIGAGVHTASIRFIVWTRDANVLVTASDRTLRWFDLPSRSVMKQEELDGEIRSCELVSLAPEHSDPNNDIGGGLPVLAVAAGREVYFWGGLQASDELKRMRLPYGVASVGLDLRGRKFVVGEEPGTWARVLRWDDGSELDVHKGHHGPIWSIAFSPDGKLYATASEDGTIKMWKNCEGYYGLWRGANSGGTE